MPSYQDIETRLAEVEARVRFLFGTMKGKTVRQTGMLDAKGQPLIETRDVTREEVYQLSKTNEIVDGREELKKETVNG